MKNSLEQTLREVSFKLSVLNDRDSNKHILVHDTVSKMAVAMDDLMRGVASSIMAVKDEMTEYRSCYYDALGNRFHKEANEPSSERPSNDQSNRRLTHPRNSLSSSLSSSSSDLSASSSVCWSKEDAGKMLEFVKQHLRFILPAYSLI